MLTDRSQGWRGLIVLALAIVALVAACSHARADEKPPLDCATVRAYVAQHGSRLASAR